MLGFMLWQPTNQSVRVDISRADVYDDRSLESTPHAWTGDFVFDQPRLPIGHFEITFSEPVLGAAGRLSLWNAEASYNVSVRRQDLRAPCVGAEPHGRGGCGRDCVGSQQQ